MESLSYEADFDAAELWVSFNNFLPSYGCPLIIEAVALSPTSGSYSGFSCPA
jgi:hypothetical protein